MRAYPATHVGLVRKQNEDTIRVAEGKHSLYILADGMGGHLAGEVASCMTCDVLEQALRNCAEPAGGYLQDAVLQANSAVYEKQLVNEDMRGMGTTLTMLWDAGEDVLLAHVGDSRAYLLRGGQMRQITEDHSMVGELLKTGAITEEQARTHPYRNVITRAVGTDHTVKCDILRHDKMQGDLWLLCSDGLTDMVEDMRIEEALKAYAPVDAVQRLVEMALQAGGKDNVSVMLLEVDA